MPRLLPIVLVGAAILVVLGSLADAPGKDARPGNAPEAAFPVGTWRVEFTNGVIEECRIGNGGESSVEEPLRRSNGMAAVQGDSVVIAFHDDRVERWTPVGRRFVVEHWFPASRLPIATPVLGIAELAQ